MTASSSSLPARSTTRWSLTAARSRRTIWATSWAPTGHVFPLAWDEDGSPQAEQFRARVASEAEFYGAMDGAVRFTQRDAIASLVITAINILAGLAIGTMQAGMTVGERGPIWYCAVFVHSNPRKRSESIPFFQPTADNPLQDRHRTAVVLLIADPIREGQMMAD